MSKLIVFFCVALFIVVTSATHMVEDPQQAARKKCVDSIYNAFYAIKQKFDATTSSRYKELWPSAFKNAMNFIEFVIGKVNERPAPIGTETKVSFYTVEQYSIFCDRVVAKNIEKYFKEFMRKYWRS